MSFNHILYGINNRVATITLNRPEAMNAIHAGLRDDILAAVSGAASDPGVKVIVINAIGKGFSSGTDLQEASDKHDTYSLLEDEYKSVFNQILHCPKPVIAAVHGPCAGVGASLALACDLIIMGENAYIYLAFANVGLIPDGGMCWHLVHNIGYKRAYQVIAEAGRIIARDALDYGLVNKVVDDEKLHEEAQAWAERLSHAAPLTLKFSKQVLQQAVRMDLSDTMRLEASLQSMCSNSEDSKEAIQAFFDKRKPVFTGK